MRTLVLLLALLPLVTACKKELGELCERRLRVRDRDMPRCPAGSSVKICALSQPCPDDTVDIGECLRPCSEGCPEGTVCHPFYEGCVAACTGEGQCRNNMCTIATGLCE
jgi:hypothetical protein